MKGKDDRSMPASAATQTQSRLLLYSEIPPWQRDNEFLLSGYRPTSGSWLLSLWSILAWHNETINIHSHLLGAIIFALLPLHFLSTLYIPTESADPTDAFCFILYFVGVSLCFVCSTSCHVSWNHSPDVAAFGNRLDFVGILLLMWGASCASIHFAFICQPHMRNLHWFLVSSSAIGCIVLTLHPSFIKPAFRARRAMMYAAFGMSAVGFILHSIYLYGMETQHKRLAANWMVLMGAFNLVGAAVYASRFPEKVYPYTFDIVGASHQIFHICVLLAGLVHYKGLAEAFLEIRTRPLIC